METVYGHRLPLVGRCALGGAVGFVLAAVLLPVAFWAWAVVGLENAPPFLVFTLVGAVASLGLALAVEGGRRRLAIVAQGALGFGAGTLLLGAYEDPWLLGPTALVGALVGVAFGLRSPAGVPMGALVGASTLSMVVVVTLGLERSGDLAVLGFLVGMGVWGAALGTTVGWSEEVAERGRSWSAFRRLVYRPAGVAVALTVLVPAQVAAAVVAPLRDPPAFCFDDQKLPGRTIFAVVDLDGDGDLDALERTAGATGVGLLRNSGGSFSAEPALAGLRIANVATGDVDADGDTDLVAVVVAEHRSFRVMLAHNDGRGAFTPGPSLPLDTDTWTLTVVDLDGDHAADAVVPTRNGPGVVWSRGGRLERGPRLPAWQNPTAADVDGDGRDDVLTFDGYSGVEVHRGTGVAQFESSRVAFPEYVTDVAVGDVDRDGDRDLLVAAYRKVVLFVNDGRQSFTRAHTLPGGRDNPWLTTGDLDGDGDLDVVVSDGPSEDTDGGVWAWENQGGGRWSDAGRVGATVDPAVTADVNRDGRADIVAPGHGSHVLVARTC